MITLNLKEKTYEFPKFREQLVEFLKIYLAIKPLQFFYKTKSENTINQLKVLPNGTIGYELYKMLDNNNLKVIPKFENHDLKHIILGYGMTSIEEIKMQAYLFGNGNKTIFCILFLASGLIFPEEWKSFYKEFKKGKKSIYIHDLQFKETITKQTEIIKTTYNNGSYN
ncbi:hypothetical protein GCM10022393_13120 [Aquimarina addita]|uniref:Ubiquinone biosynthesis protein COQ4 n=1 Tax=Aquimarina addita TaxID=870485 RepID=A0ABP7XEQ7_9FLAO